MELKNQGKTTQSTNNAFMENTSYISIDFTRQLPQLSNRHSLFLKKVPSLEAPLKQALGGVMYPSGEADIAIFFFCLTRLCIEDFNVIILLCFFGYGNGAEKILRGMYERLVTATYLHLHPEKTQKYTNFYWIQAYKWAKVVRETYGERFISDEKFQEIKKNRDLYENDYLITGCDCGAKKPNHTWDLDFVSMAKKTGELGDLILFGYYEPLKETHSSVRSCLDRLQARDRKVVYDERPLRLLAKTN